MKLFILFLLSFILFGCKSQEDTKNEKLLVGTWLSTQTIEKGFVVEDKTIYLPNGLANWFSEIKNGDTNLPPLVGFGTWHVKKDFLHYTMKKSNIPDLVPDGFTTSDQIISLTSNQFVRIRSQDGQKIIEHRISKENSLELLDK